MVYSRTWSALLSSVSKTGTLLITLTLLRVRKPKTSKALREVDPETGLNEVVACLPTQDDNYGREIIPIEKYEYSNMTGSEFVQYFNYSSTQIELNDFTEWLLNFEKSERFQTVKEKYIKIHKRLLTEEDNETRKYLLMHIDQLKN